MSCFIYIFFAIHATEPMKGKLGGKILVSCTKGILQETLETVDDVLERVFSPEAEPHLAFLSGPSFAAEVANQLPTAVTIASKVCLETHSLVDQNYPCAVFVFICSSSMSRDLPYQCPDPLFALVRCRGVLWLA